ncbi:MAG: hypothetical protein R3Y09_05920 [Clostridia bacterium]
MFENIGILTQIITISLGIITFYGVVTKPIEDCVMELKNEIKQMNLASGKTREELVKVIESAKSAHKRIDKLEGKVDEF